MEENKENKLSKLYSWLPSASKNTIAAKSSGYSEFATISNKTDFNALIKGFKIVYNPLKPLIAQCFYKIEVPSRSQIPLIFEGTMIGIHGEPNGQGSKIAYHPILGESILFRSQDAKISLQTFDLDGSGGGQIIPTDIQFALYVEFLR